MDIPQQAIRRLCRLSEEERRQFVLRMAPEGALRLDAMFATWAAEGQTAPPGEWRVWLMMAGRGFGKTRAGAEWVNAMALGGRRRIALVGATIDEARAVMVEGKSGILAVAQRLDVQLKWEPSLNRLRWISGSEATLFSGDNADGLRGPEHDYAWCDELAKWRQADAAWDNLQMGLRSGVSPRVLVTTTPKPMRLLERIRKLPGTVETGADRNPRNPNRSRPSPSQRRSSPRPEMTIASPSRSTITSGNSAATSAARSISSAAALARAATRFTKFSNIIEPLHIAA